MVGKNKRVMDVTAWLAGLGCAVIYWGVPIWATASRSGTVDVWLASFDLTAPAILLRDEELAGEIVRRGLGAPQLVSWFDEVGKMITATWEGVSMPVDEDR